MKGQNTTSAVMQQRIEPRDSLDFFPTPPWATRALCERICTAGMSVWEPACGAGHMARPLAEYFRTVVSTDIANYGFGTVCDFLAPLDDFVIGRPSCPVNWIITNPPFNLAAEFAEKANFIAENGVAMMVRSAFLEGKRRYRDLFSLYPPATILQFVERVPMVKGRLDKSATTATAYCWVVWRRNHRSTTSFQWIPPCRSRLERDSDYTEFGVAAE